MSNEKNLIPMNQRSKEEARAYGAKGGRASGAARRRKRKLKECMNALLDLPVTGDGNYNALAAMGLDPDEIDNRMLLTAALFQRAAKTGDPKAVHEIREILNEADADSEGGILGDILGAVKEID